MKLLDPSKKILLRDVSIHREELKNIDVYEKAWGGYQALKKALCDMKPDDIIEEVKKSGLRGRGGAGFPTGMKWSFVPFHLKKPIYLLVNADESEPGCFKDRHLLRENPHQLIEGIIIASYALRSHKSYIYIRGEYAYEARILEKAIKEAYEKKYLGTSIFGTSHALDIVLHRGAGAYICGEETGLISSLEGKKGYPKVKPPFPAVSGFLGCPTVVNNVETLSTVPWIIQHGGEQYQKYGTEKSKGTRLFCLSGYVNRPGVYEEELGVKLMDLINHYGGGMKDGSELKAVIPGGSSTVALTAEEAMEASMDYESIQKYGTFLGAGGVIVIPRGYPLVKILERTLEFYWDESCGQCTPCREGTGWLYKIIKNIDEHLGQESDLDLLTQVATSMMGKTICALSDAAAMPTIGFVRKFRNEFKEWIDSRKEYNHGTASI